MISVDLLLFRSSKMASSMSSLSEGIRLTVYPEIKVTIHIRHLTTTTFSMRMPSHCFQGKGRFIGYDMPGNKAVLPFSYTPAMPCGPSLVVSYAMAGSMEVMSPCCHQNCLCQHIELCPHNFLPGKIALAKAM